MLYDSYFLPQDEFDRIYARVPRITVEVIVKTIDGIILTKRGIEPNKGQWHIPGGTVRFHETLHQAVHRVAEDELGVQVKIIRLLGYIEYPDMANAGYKGWPIGIAFEVHIESGALRGSVQGEELGHFTHVPPHTVIEQARFLNLYVFETARSSI